MSKILLADRMAAVQESATLALNAKVKQLAREGRTVYNLTAGELASDTPDFIQAAVAKKLQFNKYTPVAGLPELREAIAANARDFYGLDWIEPANVIATGGVKPGLYAALLAIINPGDEVILPVPAWTTSYRPLIELCGGVVVEVPLTEEFDLDPKAIAQKLSDRTKAIIINSPNNPTGAIFSRAALEQTAKLLKGSEIAVIADDVYAKLVYDDTFTLVPTAGFDKLVILNGFSKSQALTGWRIGYVIAEAKVAQAITSLLSHITGNAPLPSQYAALAAIDEQNDRPPAATITTLKRQRQMVDEALKQVSGINYRLPGGAFYYFFDIQELTNSSLEWCQQLLDETGVALVPGEAFGTPGFARLSFVTDETTLKKALELIKQFAEKDQT